MVFKEPTNYDLILPSSTCQRHFEKELRTSWISSRAANVWETHSEIRAKPLRLIRIPARPHRRILTSNVVLYYVKGSLHKRSLIELFTQAHWLHSLTLTIDFSNLWKYVYRSNHASLP